MRRRLSKILLLVLFGLIGSAARGGLLYAVHGIPDTLDHDTLLGLTLTEAFERFGPPQQVGVVRGLESWQDDVVFIYSEGFSLFWFQDRVWQVRLTAPYNGSIRGIQMKDSSDRVREVLGNPHYRGDDWVIYQFAGPSYPIRLRIFFVDQRVTDIYLYRGDF